MFPKAPQEGPNLLQHLRGSGNHWQLPADTALHLFFLKSTLSFDIRTGEGLKVIAALSGKH